MADNVIVDELSKKNVSTWRRLAIFFLDTLIYGGLSVLLFFTSGTITIKGIGGSSISKINEIYATECIKRDDPYKYGMYDIYQLDKDKYIEKIIGSVTSYDAAMEKYEAEYKAIDTAIQKYDGYSDAYRGFTGAYYGTLIVSMLIPTFICMFIIPICNKKNKTISMFITKTSLVRDEDNVICSKLRVFARFFVIYAIEMALAYAIGQLIAIGFVALGDVICICFTKKKKTLHDLFTKTHVEKDGFTYTE